MERQDLENLPEPQLAQRHGGHQPRLIPHFGYSVFQREYREKRLLRDPTWDFQSDAALWEVSIAYDNLSRIEMEEYTARGIQEYQENQPPPNEEANVDADSHPGNNGLHQVRGRGGRGHLHVRVERGGGGIYRRTIRVQQYGRAGRGGRIQRLLE